jgi:hypothetical protein
LVLAGLLLAGRETVCVSIIDAGAFTATARDSG